MQGGIPELFRVPETLPQEVIEKMGAETYQEVLQNIPIIQARNLADAIIFGTSTRF